MKLGYARISTPDQDASINAQAHIEVAPPSCSRSPIGTINHPTPGRRVRARPTVG